MRYGFHWLTAGFTVLLVLALPVRAELVLAGVTEATGTGATSGTSFKNGYTLGIDEVNAAGGVLGARIRLVQHDIDSSPRAAADAVAKAVAQRPFAILGPVFSGLALEAMTKTAGTGIPHFVGGEAITLTRKFHGSLLRTSLSQAGSAPRLGSLAVNGLGARRLGVLWIDNAFGRDGRSALAEFVRRRGAEVVFDASVKPAQADFGEVARAASEAAMDALIVYCTEQEVSGVLKALQAAEFGKPIVSDGLIAAPAVVDASGSALERVLAHANLSNAVDNPRVQAFVARYNARFGAPPDQNAMKGYFAVSVLKAGLEQAGQLDAALFLKVLKNARLDSARHPMLFNPVAYDFFGDLDRESYFLVMRERRPRVFATVRSVLGGSVELAGGRLVPMDSVEFRHELSAARGTTTLHRAPAPR